MKGAKKFFTFLFFSLFFIAVAFSGCSKTAGSLLYSVDYIKAVPTRSPQYGQGDWYIPANDVKVYGFFGGVEEEIEIDKVAIKVIEDPNFSDENIIPVYDNQVGTELRWKGLKDVVITYNNLETRYSIAVGEPGTGDGGYGGDPNRGTGVIVIWPKDR